jgi:hypothetical protein
MTRIERIDADLFGFIRDDPLYPRHRRSIDTFFAANTYSHTPSQYPDSNSHFSSTLRLTSLASSLYKINQRLEAPLFERPLHTFRLTIARTRSPVLAGI